MMICFGFCVLIAIVGIVIFALFDEIFEDGDKDGYDIECSRFNSSQIDDIRSRVANLTALDDELEYKSIYQVESKAEPLYHISLQEGEVVLE